MSNISNPKDVASKLRSIGVSNGYACDIANGKRTPSGKLAAKIERELKIPAASWFSVPAEPLTT